MKKVVFLEITGMNVMIMRNKNNGQFKGEGESMKPTIKVITEGWIKKNNPCQEALEWYPDYLGKDPIVILKRFIKAKKYDWANWFIVRVMTYHDYVSYAVFAAEQVIHIYEKKYPDDKRPREAIEAAKKCIESPTDENKSEAARAAAEAARAAAEAAWAAWAAAGAARAAARAAEAAWAAGAARAAAKAAEAAWVAGETWAAEAAWAAGAAAGATWAAARAVWAAWAALQPKIMKYGMKLLEEK